jgi:hypothetical protein
LLFIQYANDKTIKLLETEDGKKEVEEENNPGANKIKKRVRYTVVVE